jgi:hypothetical protein
MDIIPLCCENRLWLHRKPVESSYLLPTGISRGTEARIGVYLQPDRRDRRVRLAYSGELLGRPVPRKAGSLKSSGREIIGREVAQDKGAAKRSATSLDGIVIG